jgi:hypothetical protein
MKQCTQTFSGYARRTARLARDGELKMSTSLLQPLFLHAWTTPKTEAHLLCPDILIPTNNCTEDLVQWNVEVQPTVCKSACKGGHRLKLKPALLCDSVTLHFHRKHSFGLHYAAHLG